MATFARAHVNEQKSWGTLHRLLSLFLYSTTALFQKCVRSLRLALSCLALSFEFIIRNNRAISARVATGGGGDIKECRRLARNLARQDRHNYPPRRRYACTAQHTHRVRAHTTRNILIFVYVFSLNRQSLRCSYFPKCHYAACEYKDGGLSCAKLPPASLFT
jgi:hypothetical protein